MTPEIPVLRVVVDFLLCNFLINREIASRITWACANYTYYKVVESNLHTRSSLISILIDSANRIFHLKSYFITVQCGPRPGKSQLFFHIRATRSTGVLMQYRKTGRWIVLLLYTIRCEFFSSSICTGRTNLLRCSLAFDDHLELVNFN